MKAIRSHSFLVALVYSLEPIVSRTSLFLSVVGYVLLGNRINAEKIFAVTAIYNALRTVITVLFSISLSSIAEVSVSIMRVQEVLALEEQGPVESVEFTESKKLEQLNKEANGTVKALHMNGNAKELISSLGKPSPKIMFENVSARWLEDSKEDTLSGLNICVTSNQLLAVIGPVGSGKSSIINVILQELPIRSGKMTVEGIVSYCSQEPWLYSGTVRQNILFGAEYNEDRYQRVVDVCALRSDFDQFPKGDGTQVGEKGKSVSGGQKARINLARCMYKEADIYLLDDPLSAVDANVGKHLYDKCIKEYLRNKICILVTHQLQYLKNADKIIILNDGEIQMEGNYSELKKSGLDFAKLMEQFHTDEPEENVKKIKSRQNSEMDLEESDEEDQELEKEGQEGGGIKAATYWQYFKAGGGVCSFIMMAILFISAQAVANGGDYFLTYW